MFAACLLLATSPLHGQVQGNQDVTGPYEVVEGWLGPMPWHEEGRTFGLIAAACPETTDRIFVLQGGDLPGPRPEGRPGPRSNADHEPRRFVRPHKVTMNPYDPERHVWIVDDWENQAFRFTNHGPELVLTLGEQEVIGDGPDHFGRPTDMAAFPGRTCLVNDGYVNARVVKSNGEGEYRTEWGRGATGPGAFNRVHSVKVAADRRVYVADRRNGRIQNSASPEFCSTCGGGWPSRLTSW